jgi:hypothetical protein
MESTRVDDLCAFPKAFLPFFSECLVGAISQTRLRRPRLHFAKA